MGFFWQEYWSGLPCSLPGDIPNPGIEPASLMSPALTGGFFTTSTIWCTDISTYDDLWHLTVVLWLLMYDPWLFDLWLLTFDPWHLILDTWLSTFYHWPFDLWFWPPVKQTILVSEYKFMCQCTVRLNKPKTLEFGAEKCLLQGDTKLWTPQSVSAKHFKSPGVGQVS